MTSVHSWKGPASGTTLVAPAFAFSPFAIGVEFRTSRRSVGHEARGAQNPHGQEKAEALAVTETLPAKGNDQRNALMPKSSLFIAPDPDKTTASPTAVLMAVLRHTG